MFQSFFHQGRGYYTHLAWEYTEIDLSQSFSSRKKLLQKTKALLDWQFEFQSFFHQGNNLYRHRTTHLLINICYNPFLTRESSNILVF